MMMMIIVMDKVEGCVFETVVHFELHLATTVTTCDLVPAVFHRHDANPVLVGDIKELLALAIGRTTNGTRIRYPRMTA